MKTNRFLRIIAVAIAAALLGSTAGAAPNPSLKGKKLLFVGASTADAQPIDSAAQKYLAALGFNVTFADQAEPATRAEGQDVVVISSTISSKIVGAKFKDSRAAVVLWETFVADDMGITGLRQGIDYGEEKKNSPIWLVNAPHPMQGGLPNGMLSVHKAKTPSLHWGKPAGGATVIATVAGEPDKATVYGFEKGAMMGDAFIAPARRVVLFVNTESFGELNPDGLRLVDCAMSWAANAL